MIVPSDKDYQATKLIKQGKAELDTDFKSLADWIDKTYGTKVLNIYYDVTTGAYGKQFPRLNIIFEYYDDVLKFRDRIGNFHTDKQKAIAGKFDQLVNEVSLPGFLSRLFHKKKYESKNLYVIFTAFEPVAREEANEGIPKDEIEKLKTEINNPDIWEISRFSSSATFFFYTEEQVKENSANGVKQFLADRYYGLLKKYDEFNYFSPETFSITLDSKENFDKKYEGSWFYYYR